MAGTFQISPTLDAIGLNPFEEQVYRALLQVRTARIADLARLVDAVPARVKAALGHLEAKGLVSRTLHGPPAFTAAPPELALESLVLRQIADLERVRQEATSLAQHYKEHDSDRSGLIIDAVSGFDATLHWAMQIQRTATEIVRLIDVPPALLVPVEPNPAELELLAAGVAYRVLYHESSFETPGKREAARACIAAGKQARVYSGPLIKLLIADHQRALTYDTNVTPIQDSLIVQPSFLLDQLVLLFDVLWAAAVPLAPDLTAEPVTVREALDREILALLAAGTKDETIARQLGIGVRTVRRRTAALMAGLGAATRFQAGVRAVQRGLL